jgi:D-methionine transport system substrate-binding protein
MNKLKITAVVFTLAFSAMGLISCKHSDSANTVKIGIIDGPDAPLWESAQKTALEKYKLNIVLVKFSDYNMPNEALNSGDIDANAFQHVPFLNAQIAAHGYKLVPVANTFVFPVALYSSKITKLSQITDGAKIAIPNDPSNEARALLLLQRAGLITLKTGKGVNATVIDIINNPRHLKVLELDAAQLPRVLSDVTGAIINNDYAEPAGLNPKSALLVEDSHSPYMNIIVVRTQDKDSVKIQEAIKSFQTPEVKALSQKIYNGNSVAGW